MLEEKEKPRLLELEPRLLVLFLLIAIPFTLIGSLLILGSVQKRINDAVGGNMAEVAANTSRYVDTYILHNVSDVSAMSISPTLLDPAIRTSHGYSADGATVRERLLKLDEEWQSARGQTELSEEILGREASAFLREVAVLKPKYREIMMTDVHGALIAATNVTTDFYQADEPWWRQAYGDGENGSIFVSGVGFDHSADAHVLEIAVPLRQKTGEYSLVVGILKALIDVSDLFSVVGAIRIGDSGHALLVEPEQGTIITGEDPSEVMLRRYPGMAQLREAFSIGQNSFVSQHDDGRSWLAGFSRMPEPRPSPEIGWFVVVEQLLEEAQAPARAARTPMVVFFAGVLILVLLFSLYMHFKLVRPIRQVDLREEMDRLASKTS